MAFFTYLIISIVTTLLTELLRPKPKLQDAKPAGIGDINVPTATEGRVVPVIWGRVKISGPNVVWYGDLVASPIREKVKTGLFSSDKVTTGFRYKIGLQMALCRGPVDLLRNIRNDGSFVWGVDAPTADAPIVPVDGGATYQINEPSFYGGEDAGGGGGLVGGGSIFPGNETQTASSYLGAFQSPIPAYRGTCYITFEQGDIGLSPQLRVFEFELERFPDGLDLATNVPGAENINNGANPMNVVFEVLTDSEWGLSIGAGNINVASLRIIAGILQTENNGFAWVWDNKLDVLEVIRTVEEQVDGIMFVDPVTGQYDFRLVRFDYTPGALPLLDENNVSKVTRFARQAWSETTNIVTAEFTDSRKNYTQSFALAQDMANVEIVTAINNANVRFPGVKDPILANALAWRELRQLSFPIATGSLVTDRTHYTAVPGDVLELSWARLGFVRLPIRVTRVDRGQILDNKITIDFTQDIFSVSAGTFSDPSDTSWIAVDPSAQPSLRERLWELPYQLSLDNQRHVGVICSRNGALHQGFEVWADLSGGANFTIQGTETDFTPTALIIAALSRDLGDITPYITDITIGSINDTNLASIQTAGSATIDPLDPLNIFMIDEEILFYETAIDAGGGQITLQNCHRGMFDTVPADHTINSVLWFIGAGTGLLQRASSLSTSVTSIAVKILPFTQRNALDILGAATLALTVGQRIGTPNQPGDPFINIDRFHDLDGWSRQVGTLSFTWNTRNRFTQAFDIKQQDPDITQPGSSGARVVIRRVDTSAIVVQQNNISSNQYVATDFIPQASPGIPDELDFNVTISNRTSGGLEGQQVVTRDFAIFGFGLNFGGDFGGDLNQPNTGIVLSQGDAPFIPDPLPGAGQDREWTIDFLGTFGADVVAITMGAFDELAGVSVATAFELNSTVQNSIEEFAIKAESEINAMLLTLNFTVIRIGTQIRVSTRFGRFSFERQRIPGSLNPLEEPPALSTLQIAAAPQAPIQQVVYLDWFETVPDPTGGAPIDVLSPTNAPEFGTGGSDRISFNIGPLNYDAEQLFGDRYAREVQAFVPRSLVTDQYSGNFDAIADQLNNTPDGAFFTVQGNSFITNLTFPMSRPGVVIIVDPNFRIGPEFGETKNETSPPFPPYKLLVKEGTPPVSGNAAGLPQVNNWGLRGFQIAFMPYTNMIISITADGTVFSQPVLTPWSETDVLAAAKLLRLDINADARFDATKFTETSFSYDFDIVRTANNAPFEIFTDIGRGLRIEFRDVSP